MTDSLYTSSRNATLARTYARAIASEASRLASLDHIARAATVRGYRTSEGR